MALSILPGVLSQLRAEAASSAPDECCGLLLGRRVKNGSEAGPYSEAVIEAIRPARNIHPAPREYFEIDPQTLIDAHRAARQGGPALIGYYHSHPRGPAGPSATDAAMAHGDGMIWAIIGPLSAPAGGASEGETGDETGAKARSRDEITFWRDGPSGFLPITPSQHLPSGGKGR